MTDAAPADSRSIARREAIAAKLADFLLEHGLAAASLRPLAQAAGISDRMLIYYFTTRDAAIAAGLDAAAGRLLTMLEAARSPQALPADALRARLAAIVLDNDLDPFMALWFEIIARSARGEGLYREVAARIVSGFLDWIASQLDAGGARDVSKVAIGLLATIDGLAMLKAAGRHPEQLQS